MKLDKLTKLLQLTTSSNDHEALAAMRKANASLERAGENWETLLGRLALPSNIHFQPPTQGPVNMGGFTVWFQ